MYNSLKQNSLNSKSIKVVAFLCTFLLVSNIFASNFYYISKDFENKTDASSISTVATPEFSFQSVSQIIMEPSTGRILYANNENEKLLPASVTKVMTLLLIMEQIDSGKLKYDDKVTCSLNASKMGGSQIWFKEGEQLSVDEALKAICVVSANDVTVAMAEMIGGTEQNFVKMMNDKAVSLGMENTNFMNSHGIDEEGHYTSAKDIAIMSRELINKHPDILKYTSIWMDTLRNGEFGLSSTNKLIRFYDGANGLKTGSTSQALYNLSATATRNGTTFIAVVMKAPTSDIRLQEIKQLLDYAFATYEVKNISDKGTLIETIKINKNVVKEANVITESSVSALIEKGSKIETDQKITIEQNLTAPLKKDSIVGKIEVLDKNGRDVIGSANLILDEDIERSNFKDYLSKLFNIYIINN